MQKVVWQVLNAQKIEHFKEEFKEVPIFKAKLIYFKLNRSS